MNNMNTYAKSFLYGFKERKFNELDALILTWLSYFHIPNDIYNKASFKSIKIKDLYNAKYFDDMTFDVYDKNSSLELLSYLAASPRFRDIDIYYYVENTSKEIEKQFSAMTFYIGNKTYFTSFRGTDHSFVGWKEDLNMAYLKSIPSQIAAKKYLTKVMSQIKGNFIIGGHSKGGNLAVFSSSFVDEKYKKRIKSIYNFDGPSLRKNKNESKDYKSISKKIIKYVPQSSIVGMIFETTENFHVIKSNSVGVLQHCPFSWEIDKDKLKPVKNNTIDSKAFRASLNSLVDSLSESELKSFVNTIYKIIDNAESDTIENLIKNANKDLPRIFSGIKNLDDNQKKLINKVASIYFKNSFSNTIDTIKKSINLKTNQNDTHDNKYPMPSL